MQYIRHPRLAFQVFILEFFCYQGISPMYTNVKVISSTFSPSSISISIPLSRAISPLSLIAFTIAAKFDLQGSRVIGNTFVLRARLQKLIPAKIQQNPINDRYTLRYRPKLLINRRNRSEIVRRLLVRRLLVLQLLRVSKYSRLQHQISSLPTIGLLRQISIINVALLDRLSIIRRITKPSLEQQSSRRVLGSLSFSNIQSRKKLSKRIPIYDLQQKYTLFYNSTILFARSGGTNLYQILFRLNAS